MTDTSSYHNNPPSLSHPELGYYIPAGTHYFCIWLVRVVQHFMVRNRAQVTYQKVEILWSALNYKPANLQDDTVSLFQTDRGNIAFDRMELIKLFDQRMADQLKRRDRRIRDIEKLMVDLGHEHHDIRQEIKELVRDTPPWDDIEFKTRPKKQGAKEQITTIEELQDAWNELERKLKDGDHE